MRPIKFITKILALQAITGNKGVVGELDKTSLSNRVDEGELDLPYTEFMQVGVGAENGDLVKVEVGDKLEITPSMVDEIHNRGRKHYEMKEYESALEDYALVSSYDPNRKWVNFDIAEIFRNRGDYSKAVEYHSKEIEIDNQKGQEPSYHQRFKCYFKMGKFEEAYEDWLKVTNKERFFDPTLFRNSDYNYEWLFYKAAQELHKNGSDELALNYIAEEIKFHPDSRCSDLKIDILQSLGRHEEAVNECDNRFRRVTSEINKEYKGELYFKKAVSYHALGDDAKSLRNLKVLLNNYRFFRYFI